MKNLFFSNFWSTIKLLGSRESFQPAVSSSLSNEPASKVCYADDPQINPQYRMDQTEYKGVKNIIFDLGNVIVDLDIAKSDQLLFDLTGSSYQEASAEELKVFNDFETGHLSEDLFLNYFIGKSDGRAQAIDVINAWNAMLVNIPWPRLEMMRKLKNNYQVFILSNTNETHIRWTNHYIQTRYREAGFKSFVHHALYSHNLGARKPDEVIFNKVLETYQLVPQETVFFDDNFDNIQAAKQLGIQAIQVHPADEILDMVGRLPTPHVSKKVP